MTIDIVIPCYRQGRWLAEGVRSCLAQSLAPSRVIVVDDGSDDDTATVAKSFGRDVQYVHQANGGQSVARNTGLKHCRGSHVLFLDADDVLHEDALKTLATAADDTTMAMMGWKPFEIHTNEPGTEVYPPLKEPIRSLLRNNPGPPHMVLAPRPLVQKAGGWDPKLSGTSDWDCWFRTLFAGAGLNAVPFIGAFYRQSPGQLSRNELVMQEMLALAGEKLYHLSRKHPQRLKEWGESPRLAVREFRLRAAREWSHLAFLQRGLGLRRAAGRNYVHSLKLSPNRRALMGLINLARRPL